MTAVIRDACRVVLLDGQDRILLLHLVAPGEGIDLWFTPGGGLDGDEDHAAAGRRELREETGIADVALGPVVWVRTIALWWQGVEYVQRERFIIARTRDGSAPAPDPSRAEEAAVLVEARWWTVEDLRATDQLVSPRRLAAHLTDLIAGDRPNPPLDISAEFDPTR